MPTVEITKKPEIKYQKIADGLREQIQSGILKPGDRLPSLAEMYDAHGLSRSTVERVHRLLESDGLVVREQGRGTFVTKPAKRAKGLIGLCGFGFDEKPRPPYWADIVEGVQQAAALEEQGVVFLESKTFSGWDRVDCVVLAGSLTVTQERMHSVPRDVPRVSILSEIQTHDCVNANEYQGGTLVTEHLLSLGHQRIACLLNRETYPTDRRYAGYRHALQAAGISFDERWVRDYALDPYIGPVFTGRGKMLMDEWLREDWHTLGCTALIVQNDLVSVGVLEALREAGVSVPGQVSVVGYDNLDLCNYLTPRLTSVEVPRREIAMTAVKLLRQQLEYGKGIPTSTTLPVRLEIRESTAPPRTR